MTFQRPVLLIFHGGAGDRPAERAMGEARLTGASRTAGAALAAGFEAVILVTDTPGAIDAMPPGVLLDIDEPGAPFAFDSRLRALVGDYGLQKPAVMGSGSVPLLGVEEFRLIVEQLEARDSRFVTNNFFSSDLTAWTPGEALFEVGAFARDNVLPRRLRDEAGLAPVILPRTTATQFDLDTPADLEPSSRVTPTAATSGRSDAVSGIGVPQTGETHISWMCSSLMWIWPIAPARLAARALPGMARPSLITILPRTSRPA